MAYIFLKQPTVTITTVGTTYMDSNKTYIADTASLLTLQLPGTTASKAGDTINIIGKGNGLWKVTLNTGQTIYFGNQNATLTTGNLSSTLSRDCISLICISSSEWQVFNAVGSISIT